jgi:Spy/CpxP family protein refolding chaperone
MMLKRTWSIAAVVAGLLPAMAPADALAADSPYADEQQRDIKALAPEEIEGLAEGHGMGLAMAAELNHYPGPRHVLDLAEALELTPEQRDAAAAAFAAVQDAARPLGRLIIADEQALDALFAGGAAEPAAVDALVERIAAQRGRLRAIHLAAHVKMRALLTPQQVARYDELRGYGSGAAPDHQHMP